MLVEKGLLSALNCALPSDESIIVRIGTDGETGTFLGPKDFLISRIYQKIVIQTPIVIFLSP